jgi:tetratricopeptide (TPR) repeat protein
VTFAVDKSEVELSQQLGLGEPAVASGAEIRTVLRRRRGRGLGSANSGDVLFNSLLESAPTLAAAVDLFQSRSSDVAAANDLLKVYMDTRLLDDLSPLETMFPVLQLKTLNLESLPLTIMAANNAIYHRRYAQAMEKYLIAYRLDKEQPLTCLCLSAFIVFLSMHHTLHQSADGRHQVYGKGLAFLIKYAELRKGQQAKQSDVMSEKERLHSLCLQQEVWYNMGRSYHDVKLLHLAVAMYNKALAIAEDEPKVKTLPSHCTREAAHNLVVIYKSSKAINLALSIMQRHLSFP